MSILVSPLPFQRFFTAREAAVVDAAAARLVPAELGHAGAGEAGVADFLDGLLGTPPRVYAGGSGFIALSAAQAYGWQRRIGALRDRYRRGVRELDELAGGDFSTAGAAEQDRVLCAATGFRDLLFDHTIQAMYSDPVYGGNRNRTGWRDIAFSPARGYPDAAVSSPDGPDPVCERELVDRVGALLDEAVRCILEGGDG